MYVTSNFEDWELLDVELPDAYQELRVFEDSQLLVATWDSLYRYDDGVWKSIFGSLRASYGIYPMRTKGDSVYIIQRGNLYYSNDRGETFNLFYTETEDRVYAQNIYVDDEYIYFLQ